MRFDVLVLKLEVRKRSNRYCCHVTISSTTSTHPLRCQEIEEDRNLTSVGCDDGRRDASSIDLSSNQMALIHSFTLQIIAPLATDFLTCKPTSSRAYETVYMSLGTEMTSGFQDQTNDNTTMFGWSSSKPKPPTTDSSFKPTWNSRPSIFPLLDPTK